MATGDGAMQIFRLAGPLWNREPRLRTG